MEKKLIALVSIAVLVGLGGGYGLGYVIRRQKAKTLKIPYVVGIKILKYTFNSRRH